MWKKSETIEDIQKEIEDTCGEKEISDKKIREFEFLTGLIIALAVAIVLMEGC